MAGSLEYRWHDMGVLHRPIEEAGADADQGLVVILTPGHALGPDPGADLALTARAHVGVLIHGHDPNRTASLDQGPNEV